MSKYEGTATLSLVPLYGVRPSSGVGGGHEEEYLHRLEVK